MGEIHEPETLFAYVTSIATDVLNERLSPIDGAKRLWQLSSEMRELPEALLTFVGLASEWDDHPPDRPRCEREILIEMERLRRRFGR